jgi:ribosome maturation factor RimP
MVENVDYERLEVSSPGLDRPLVKPADYERFAGNPVKTALRVPLADGRRRLKGMLLGLADGMVNLEVDGGALAVPFADIESTRLAPRFPDTGKSVGDRKK